MYAMYVCIYICDIMWLYVCVWIISNFCITGSSLLFFFFTMAEHKRKMHTNTISVSNRSNKQKNNNKNVKRKKVKKSAENNNTAHFLFTDFKFRFFAFDMLLLAVLFLESLSWAKFTFYVHLWEVKWIKMNIVWRNPNNANVQQAIFIAANGLFISAATILFYQNLEIKFSNCIVKHGSWKVF